MRLVKLLPRVTFILGGAASGKSAYAERLTALCDKPMIYLATSRVLDGEMRAKVDRHIRQRGDGWTTVEAPENAAGELAGLTAESVCLFDCATMWLTNQMLGDGDLAAEQDRLLAAIDACRAQLVIVSNEVGHGIVPDNRLARDFREAQGRLNIRLAAAADLVVQVTAGLPTVLKGSLP